MDRALELGPDAPFVLEEAAWSLGLLDQHARAEALARRLLTLRPASAGSHAVLAWLLDRRERFDEAGETARAALAIDPNHALAWELCGVASLHRGAFVPLLEALPRPPG